jgi:ketosteroid isomerase-like protein
MSARRFDTPGDAERAFYDALETNDLEALMESWAPSEDIVCVHPMGPPLNGRAAVRDSWQAICHSGQQLRFNVIDLQYDESDQLAIHVVREEITMGKEKPKFAAMVSTNVFRRGDDGWHMVLHHASPGPSGEHSTPDVTLH